MPGARRPARAGESIVRYIADVRMCGRKIPRVGIAVLAPDLQTAGERMWANVHLGDCAGHTSLRASTADVSRFASFSVMPDKFHACRNAVPLD